jgi:predicted nucleotide-binding protein
MDKIEAINILNDFNKLLNDWSNEGVYNIRSQINRKIKIVKQILESTENKIKFTITTPGGESKEFTPIDNIFNTTLGVDVIPTVIDIIDVSIGILESKDTFELIENSAKSESIAKNNSKEVFIVHGHDNELKETVTRFIEKLNLVPIILHEQSNSGLTIIEKFEKHSDVAFAIVLMSPDDVGAAKENKENLKYRARQNVIFELGYFTGKLGRNKVCAIIKNDIERHSDYDGVLYIDFDISNGWKLKLSKELKISGFEIDLNKAI